MWSFRALKAQARVHGRVAVHHGQGRWPKALTENDVSLHISRDPINKDIDTYI